MAAKTVEVNHYPHHAQQFFFVLSAIAINIARERIVLQKKYQMVESIVKLTSIKEMFYDRISLSEANPK